VCVCVCVCVRACRECLSVHKFRFGGRNAGWFTCTGFGGGNAHRSIYLNLVEGMLVDPNIWICWRECSSIHISGYGGRNAGRRKIYTLTACVSLLSRKCRNFDVPHPYWPPWSVAELIYLLEYNQGRWDWRNIYIYILCIGHFSQWEYLKWRRGTLLGLDADGRLLA
jgi:hypothetical protein